MDNPVGIIGLWIMEVRSHAISLIADGIGADGHPSAMRELARENVAITVDIVQLARQPRSS